MLKKFLPLLLLIACSPPAEQIASAPGDAPLAAYQPQPYIRISHPEWSKNAVIYELNVRQFSEAGTFEAAREQLPRLKDLGVDIIWLMPIHEIGSKNRKGTLGSYYSVKDFYSVNPEFGSLDDLKAFVAAAHKQGMYVILDWVANHTAWDNPLVDKHPDWYERDWQGNFHPTPWWDWSDIIDLDYNQPGLRRYMTQALKYWVEEADIDGYRCDVAGYVPLDFWENVRQELDAIKPVFMLAEWESRDVHARAFDASYAWSWYETMHEIAQGKKDVTALYGYYSANESAWPRDAMRMTMVSNHDKNSWEGTQFEAFGEALAPAIVLSVLGEGIPMIYSGQEAGLDRRLAFFEKDPISWRDHWVGDLYRQLIAIKKSNPALANGAWGATMQHVPNSRPDRVFSFVRQNEANKVFVVINFSPAEQQVSFGHAPHLDSYRDVKRGKSATIAADTRLTLAPWDWVVFTR